MHDRERERAQTNLILYKNNFLAQNDHSPKIDRKCQNNYKWLNISAELES